jgi:hypothetical protein
MPWRPKKARHQQAQHPRRFLAAKGKREEFEAIAIKEVLARQIVGTSLSTAFARPELLDARCGSSLV